MLKEPKGKYLYRCPFCDAIKATNDKRAELYCWHNGMRVQMTRKVLKLKSPEGKVLHDI